MGHGPSDPARRKGHHLALHCSAGSRKDARITWAGRASCGAIGSIAPVLACRVWGRSRSATVDPQHSGAAEASRTEVVECDVRVLQGVDRDLCADRHLRSQR
jgi:hypothetical protein